MNSPHFRKYPSKFWFFHHWKIYEECNSCFNSNWWALFRNGSTGYFYFYFLNLLETFWSLIIVLSNQFHKIFFESQSYQVIKPMLRATHRQEPSLKTDAALDKSCIFVAKASTLDWLRRQRASHEPLPHILPMDTIETKNINIYF